MAKEVYFNWTVLKQINSSNYLFLNNRYFSNARQLIAVPFMLVRKCVCFTKS